MRKRTIFAGVGALLLLVAVVAVPILLAPGTPAVAMPAAEPMVADEQAAIVAAMRPSRATDRPVIAIIAWNQATELSDFFSAYGVLKRADVADVTVVAERAEPVQLYPGPKITPEATIADFVAERAGLGSAATLSRAFRKHLGTTPDGYRERFRIDGGSR